jgi:hypothetical protein
MLRFMLHELWMSQRLHLFGMLWKSWRLLHQLRVLLQIWGPMSPVLLLWSHH